MIFITYSGINPLIPTGTKNELGLIIESNHSDYHKNDSNIIIKVTLYNKAKFPVYVFSAMALSYNLQIVIRTPKNETANTGDQVVDIVGPYHVLMPNEKIIERYNLWNSTIIKQKNIPREYYWNELGNYTIYANYTSLRGDILSNIININIQA